MRVLVTNDDGVDAKGLQALAEGLALEHEVWILAPDRERSGVAHALTLGDPSRVRELGPHRFSCSGTPTDCVILAMLGTLGAKPELVVSGVNRGSNLGTDILYSGTCGAACEAVLSGVPGIAVSCVSRLGDLQYGSAVAFVVKNLARLAGACSEEVFININAPSSDDPNLGASWSSPCARKYGNGLRSFEGPDGSSYHFLTSEQGDYPGSESNDCEVVGIGRISVSPILAQPQIPVGFRVGRDFG